MSENNNLERNELIRLQRRVERMDARLRLVLGSALLAAMAAVLLWAPGAMSEPEQPVDTTYDDLYHFSANTPAVAAEVNSNFATLRGLADGNAAGIADNAAGVAGNTADITTNAAGIAVLQSTKLNTLGGTVTGNLTVNGRLNVGFRRKECAYTSGANHADCSCNSNEVVISGGAYGSLADSIERHSIRESRPVSEHTWRVACVNEYGRRADCLGFSILCARLD